MQSYKMFLTVMSLCLVPVTGLWAQDVTSEPRKTVAPKTSDTTPAKNLDNAFGIKLSPALAGTVVVGMAWRESVRLLGRERMKLTDFFRKSKLPGAVFQGTPAAGSMETLSNVKVLSEQIKVSAGSLNPVLLSEIRPSGGIEKMTKILPDAATLRQAKEITQMTQVRAKSSNWRPSELQALKS